MPRPRDAADTLPAIDWARFEGLTAPTYTQTPDELFDWVMAYLTGAELKVLLYIVRRTFGFKKAADAISIDQLCNGIVKRDGQRLDLGTGLKRATVLEALRSLREKNLVLAQQQFDAETGSRPTVYALRIRSDPKIGSITQQLPGGPAQHTGGSAAVDAGVNQSVPGGMFEHTRESGKVASGVAQDGPGHPVGQTPRVGRGTPPGCAPLDAQHTGLQQTGEQETDPSKPSKPSKGPPTVDAARGTTTGTAKGGGGGSTRPISPRSSAITLSFSTIGNTSGATVHAPCGSGRKAASTRRRSATSSAKPSRSRRSARSSGGRPTAAPKGRRTRCPISSGWWRISLTWPSMSTPNALRPISWSRVAEIDRNAGGPSSSFTPAKASTRRGATLPRSPQGVRYRTLAVRGSTTPRSATVLAAPSVALDTASGALHRGTPRGILGRCTYRSANRR